MDENLELFLNEQRADIAALNAVLQVLLIRLIGDDPDAAKGRLQDLKKSTLAAIGRILVRPDDEAGDRMRRLSAVRAEAFFGPLEEAVDGAKTILSGGARN